MRHRSWLFPAIVLALASFVVAALSLSPPARIARAQGSDFSIVPLVDGWNISSVTSGSAVLSSSFHPNKRTAAIRIGVVLGSSAPLSIRESDGTRTFTSYLNGGTNLSAGTMYTFVWETRYFTDGASGPSTYNFIVGSPTTVPILRVTQVDGAVD